MFRLPKLTERVDEARNPANNLVVCMAFSSVGIVNLVMSLTLGGIVYALHLWH